MPRYSEAYQKLLQAGPFPNQLDLWADQGRYFQQIHAGMIANLTQLLQPTLLTMGYILATETSLQIADQGEPDLVIRRSTDKNDPAWDYEQVIMQLEIDPAEALWDAPHQFDALFIREQGSKRLVTVVEIISPSNKRDPEVRQIYQKHRHALSADGVYVVEIDPTLSVQRMIHHPRLEPYAYLTVVYLPQLAPRLFGSRIGEPLRRFALPLIETALSVDPQVSYRDAYESKAIAAQLMYDDAYTPDHLPYPSLLTPEYIQMLQAHIATWRDQLHQAATSA